MQYSILNAKNSLPSTEELVELYDAVGWSAYTRTPERLAPMLTGSRYLYVARENTAEGAERLIGLVRAVGDGQTIAYIQDLLVHPQAQHHGIGSALLGKDPRRFRPGEHSPEVHHYRYCGHTRHRTLPALRLHPGAG